MFTNREMEVAARLLAVDVSKGLQPRIYKICKKLLQDFDLATVKPKPKQTAKIQIECNIEAGVFYKIQEKIISLREKS